MLKVTPKRGSIPMDKRQHVLAVLSSTCPKCGAPWEKDLTNDHLSYPETGKPITITAYCGVGDCDHEWTAGKVKLALTLTVVENNSKFPDPIPTYGDKMTVRRFLQAVLDGAITDDDGFGHWATKSRMSKSTVNLSRVASPPKGATHVVWFNK